MSHFNGRQRRRTLRELLRAVDEISARTACTIDVDGTSDKGYILVEGHGFELWAYFRDDRIVFMLHGPFEGGSEPELVGTCQGLQGVMGGDCLKGALRLLEEGKSPLEYIIAESQVVADYIYDE